MGIQRDGIWKGYKKGSLTTSTDIGRCEDTWHLLEQQSYAIGYDVCCWFLSSRQSACTHYPRAAEWVEFVVGWQCHGQFGIRDIGGFKLNLGRCGLWSREARIFLRYQSVDTSTRSLVLLKGVLVTRASYLVEVNNIGLSSEELMNWKLSRLQGLGPMGMPADVL